MVFLGGFLFQICFTKGFLVRSSFKRVSIFCQHGLKRVSLWLVGVYFSQTGCGVKMCF